ncbi:methyl-accepting chemotaxis protein [Thiocystis violascens]|uniref:Methyl-accepting chemotaxis protein n=1 Tax=Thiocystis violascens (strain ATCC 17096 / DSM 198 / 6111) TaxID=765911 RepID=I3Y669_THIV6|nr:methyl-accepting chemotaxis protein [Thiocystis violascens]AFL72487.1 methyl-accepting chemotaxis protein [Thiocystis violascens DSM 198]
MKWFQNLAFRYKLLLPLGLIALLFILFAWGTLRRVDTLGEEVASLARVNMPVAALLLQADRDLYQALVAERTLIFMNVGSPDYAGMAAQHAENVKQARERMDRAAAIIATSHLGSIPEVSEKLKTFGELRQVWEDLSNRVVRERGLDTRAGRSTAIDLTLREAREAFEQMRTILDQLEEVVTDFSEQAAGRTESAVSASRLQTLVLLAIGMGFLMLMALGLPPLIIGPLRRILHRVQDLAEGEGDLTARLNEDTRDEVGELAKHFNRLLAKLHRLVAQAATSAKQVDDASENLASVATKSDEALLEQSTQIQMVATAMHEMAATVNEVALNTSRAAESARTADVGVRSGAKVVGEASVAIGQLAEVVSRAAEAIAALESETKRIGAVLEVIKGIAEQTSLLALNAAIEAARAGERGRGFAVVAAEVRNLASRTQQSTGEIESMIASLQSSARNVVGVMQAGRGMVDETLQKASQASQSLEEITRAVATINAMNDQIASAAEEQTAVTEEINGNTLSIQRLAEHAVAANRQTALARGELVSLAQSLNAGLSQFKV